MACRAGQRREQLEMLPLRLVGARDSSPEGHLALVVGQERVVPHRCRERTFDEPEHDHQVQIESDAHADRADEDAVADAPDTSEISLEARAPTSAAKTSSVTAPSTSARPASRSSARSMRSKAFCSTRGQRARCRSEPAISVRPRRAHALCSAQPLGVRRRPGRRSDPARSHAGPVTHRFLSFALGLPLRGIGIRRGALASPSRIGKDGSNRPTRGGQRRRPRHARAAPTPSPNRRR